MTYLLLQTFLLLLSAYFLGAFSGCLARRVVASRPARMQTAAVEPMIAERADVVPLEAPRSIDPVQPKINILPRPKPTVVPAPLDISRFERALTGPDPNEGMPREMVVEICPAVLELPTGPPLPWPPAPEPVVDEVLPAEEEIVAETEPPAESAATEEPATDVYIDDDDTSYDESAASGMGASGGMAMATAAAAAAMSAARDAEARSEDDGAEAPESDLQDESNAKYEEASAEDHAAPVAGASGVLIEDGDDLQFIRAIDADTEQALKHVGVTTFEHIALWTPDDIELYGEELNLGTRIDDEQWIEQAQILAKGGDTYYSRNRAAALQEAAGGDEEAQIVADDSTVIETEVASASEEAERGIETALDSDSSENLADTDNVATDDDMSRERSEAAATLASYAAGSEVSHADEGNAEVAGGGADLADQEQVSGTAADAVAESADESNEPTPSPLGQRSVAEMAAAAAAAIAAASASVTRGIRPIEPISPLSRVNPNIVLPARLSDAIKERDAKAQAGEAGDELAAAKPIAKPASVAKGGDDLKRIRGVGVLIERQLNANGVTRYEQIANWSSSDIEAISAKLDFKGRIERENWVEQARILSSGGETEFSKRVDRGDVETSSGGNDPKA